MPAERVRAMRGLIPDIGDAHRAQPDVD